MSTAAAAREPDEDATSPGGLPPHYYVGPLDVERNTAGRRGKRGCARSGCGKPPADPIHLRPKVDF